jgi:Na+-driven multidrug efflux pump
MGLLVNASLNLALIPGHGMAGAAAATVAAQLVATLFADALWPSTRKLFRLKLRAMAP